MHTWTDLNRQVRSAKMPCLDTEDKECAVRYKLPELEDSAKTIVGKFATISRQIRVFYIWTKSANSCQITRLGRKHYDTEAAASVISWCIEPQWKAEIPPRFQFNGGTAFVALHVFTFNLHWRKTKCTSKLETNKKTRSCLHHMCNHVREQHLSLFVLNKCQYHPEPLYSRGPIKMGANLIFW